MKNAGLVILVIGILLTVYSTFTFFTREKVLEIGSVEISKEKEHTVNWSPYVGVALVLVGGVMLFKGRKLRRHRRNIFDIFQSILQTLSSPFTHRKW